MKNKKETIPFEKKHPKLNLLIGLLILLVMLVGVILLCLKTINGIVNGIDWIGTAVAKMDAVVIVALITGGVSIIGVVISSIVSKIIDYKKSRKEYLSQKREEPYGQFVDMVYKIQLNAPKKLSYTENEMVSDLSKFSKQITLWGSSNVVSKWVAFRKNGANPNVGADNLFLLEKIMNDMRKDLGLKKVKEGNLLSFFVNNIDKFIKK